MSRSTSATIAERLAAALALALVASLASAAPWPWRFTHAAGDPIGVHGTVADLQGRPLVGLEVALEVSDPHFDWRRLSHVRGEVTRRVVRTAADGSFALEWSWNPGQRHFELVVSLDETLGTRSYRAELTRLDVTDRLAHAAQLAAALAIERSDEVARVRDFLAAVVSVDERRIWEESGMPEAVDTDTDRGVSEAAWWYFATGRVVRFRDGRLAEVQTFAPIGATAEADAR